MTKITSFLTTYSALILTALVGVLTACSDEHLSALSLTSDGELTFRLAVADERRVGVRSEEAQEEAEVLTSLCVLVFEDDEDDSRLISDVYEVTDWTTDDTGLVSFTMIVDKEISDRSSLCFIILGNYDDAVKDAMQKGETTLGALRSTKGSLENSAGVVQAMSGMCVHYDLFAEGVKHVVSMKRNVAAVEVVTGDEETPLDFIVYGTPAIVSPTAGADGTCNPASEKVEGEGVTIMDGATAYVGTLANTSPDAPYASDAYPFVVIKADYAGKIYYYRLSFTDLDNEGHPRALDVMPNHKYKFNVKKVTAPGYGTVAEAAAGAPSTDVDYIIYDIQPSIFNMASDGSRELGASREVTDMLGDACKKEFQVKCFPAPDSLDDLLFLTTEEWVTVSPEPVSSEEIEDHTGQKGVLYTFKAVLDKNRKRRVREATISVNWLGLDVTVAVRQSRSFITDRHTIVRLDILDEDGSLYRRIEDYWTFLRGEGTAPDAGITGKTLVNAPVLYGTTETTNGGRVRTHGLHFPVMNGGRSYEYEITPDFNESEGAAYYEVALADNSIFASHVVVPSGRIELGTPIIIKFTDDSFDLYSEENSLVFRAFDASGEEIDGYSFDMYHLGFFDWSDYPEFRTDRTYKPEIEQAWYYYEVIEYKSGDHSHYWLDRNLGARSCGYDIIDRDGKSIFSGESIFPYLEGDGSAVGGIYHSVATPSTVYGDPIRREDFGPAGYCLPTMTIFNELRDSHNFVTTHTYSPAMTGYYNAYYICEDGRRMYFPKAGQYQNGVMTSEGRMGYYWTNTAATGFEKKEIGQWLSTLVMSGNSTYFTRARLIDPVSGMSARLVNRTDDAETYYQTYFTVKGATHVFLYHDNGTTREWVAAWPGEAVADAEIAFDREVNYVYETSRNVAYKVIFNFVTPEGRIITMAASEAETGIKAEGWAAEGSFIFNESHQRIE